MNTITSIIQPDQVEQRILLIRGQKVIVDADLAEFYGVTTKRLNEQVKRNKERFPEDFMFQLSVNEKSEVVAKCDHLTKLKFSATLPYAFTEHGAIMAASVLNSPQATQMSVFIVRAFVKLRRTIAENKELAQKISQVEQHLAEHDEQIVAIVKAIKQLMQPKPLPQERRIGFKID